jgi:hypothetical protein
MRKCFGILCRAFLLAPLLALACREKNAEADKSSTASLPPVFSLGPATNTNWDPSAGPVMLVSVGDVGDSAAVVLPEATDSTIDTVRMPPSGISEAAFDLYGRAGKIGSSTIRLASTADSSGTCNGWPIAHLSSGHQGWQVALASGSVRGIPLDSIEGLSSVDSASLAASLTQSVAALPVASDLTFRRLPFRVRYAYLVHFDSSEIVAADIVRALNEEANPRIEHIFLIGERERNSIGKFALGYYNRTAGAEETTQAAAVLAALEIGSSRRKAFVVNVESDKSARFGLIERAGIAEWRPSWWSANTGC